MKKKKLNKGGNCYETAYRVMCSPEMKDRNPVVVHGLVGGFIMQGEYVPLHGHAWVEYCEHVPIPAGTKHNIPEGHPDYFETWFCVDKSNGHDGCMPREVYYHFGGVREDETWRYEEHEVCKQMCRTENYGPWEDYILETEKKELKV